MSPFLKAGACIALLTTFVCAARANQELSASVGSMSSPDASQSSYTWQVDYRRDFSRHFAWSMTWMNEGHVTGHRRDGLATQGWAYLPLGNERFRVGVGVGLYQFFDTQLQPGADWRNVHGWAPIGSFSATYYLSSPWFWRFGINHIIPHSGITANTFSIGLGYRLRETRSKPSIELPYDSNAPENSELTVFLGRTIVNERPGNHAIASSVEFRHGINRWIDWTLAWLHEGSPDGINRKGLASQFWLANRSFEERLSFGLGAGLYVYVDGDRANPGASDQPKVTWLISPTISYQFSERWSARFIFHRVTTEYHRDADVLLFGLGRRW